MHAHVMFDFFCSEKQMLERELLLSNDTESVSLPQTTVSKCELLIFNVFWLVQH